MFLFSLECFNILAQSLVSEEPGGNRNLRVNISVQLNTWLRIIKPTQLVFRVRYLLRCALFIQKIRIPAWILPYYAMNLKL